MPPELSQRIQQDADRLGLRWNDVAERILAQAFSLPVDGKKSQQNGNKMAAITYEEVPDDDD